MVLYRDTNNTSKGISGNVTDPYKTPTISINDNGVIISKHDTSRSIHIDANNSGDSAATTVKVWVNGNEETTSLGNSSGNYNFTPSNKGVNSESSYNVYAKRIHNSNNNLVATSGTLTLYTYRIPAISSVSIANSIMSGNGSNTLTWYTNGRKWGTNLESNFKTYLSLNDGSSYIDTNSNPTGDQTNSKQTTNITNNIISQFYNATSRSRDTLDVKIKVKRTNPSSGKEATSGTVKLTIQYKPKYSPENLKYYKYDSSKTDNKGDELTPGNTYYTSDYPKILVTWDYPDKVDGGVISGYGLTVYKDAYQTVKKTYDISTSSLSASKKLDIKTDLERGVLNYIEIVPYYTKPDGTGIIKGPALRQQFIIPIGKLHKPIIDGPINLTTWHNKNFRILVTAPIDDDFEDIGVTEDNYRYENIQLNINRY